MSKKNDNVKEEALNNTFSLIEKQFWKWAIMRLWDKEWWWNIETYSSWSLNLDLALWWWYAKWRIIEIYWLESSWKTTLTLHAIAEVQKKWWIAAFIDAEHALDPKYAEKIWVDLKNLLVSQPDYWEQALEITETLIRSWTIDLIVIDSVAALTPKAEIEWEMWDSHMWLQARLMSQALRKITWPISKTWTTVIFINQIRMKIWISFWNPETTTWWNALKFYASLRIDIRKVKTLDVWTGDDKEFIGNQHKLKVVKNKVAPPFKTANFDIMFSEGISKEGDLIDVWVKENIIEKKWAFYYYGGDKIWQGRESVKNLLKTDANLFKKISQDLLSKMNNWNDEKEKKENLEKKNNKEKLI